MNKIPEYVKLLLEFDGYKDTKIFSRENGVYIKFGEFDGWEFGAGVKFEEFYDNGFSGLVEKLMAHIRRYGVDDDYLKISKELTDNILNNKCKFFVHSYVKKGEEFYEERALHQCRVGNYTGLAAGLIALYHIGLYANDDEESLARLQITSHILDALKRIGIINPKKLDEYFYGFALSKLKEELFAYRKGIKYGEYNLDRAFFGAAYLTALESNLKKVEEVICDEMYIGFILSVLKEDLPYNAKKFLGKTAKILIENLEYPHEEITELNLCSINADIKKVDFKKFPKLRKLNINNLGVSEIPEEICGLKLKCLYATTNKIRKIPALNVEELHLTYNYLTEIPLIEGVKRLYLEYNDIREIPAEIYKMDLEELSLKGNYKISNLPPELFKLSNLKMLDLSMTKIKEIPPEINNLKNLKVLRLQRTHIERLPELEIPIKEINIEGTKIKEIPQSLMKKGVIIYI